MQAANNNFRTWFGNEISVQTIYFPTTEEELISCLNKTRLEAALRVFGSTSNLLFSLREYSGPFVFITRMPESIDFDTGWVSVATETSRLSQIAAVHHYEGLEGIEGIPGTLGGALTMNASAYGQAIFDNVVEVKVYDRTSGTIKILSKNQCGVSERSSVFLTERNLIILAAKFHFRKGDLNAIRRLRRRYHLARHTYSDYTLPSLGSTFVKVTGNLNDDIIQFVLNEKANNLGLKLRYFILRFYNSRYFTIFRRNLFWNPYYWVFNKYYPNVLDNEITLSNFTLNSLLNNSDNVDAAIKHINTMQNILPELRLENEIIDEG